MERFDLAPELLPPQLRLPVRRHGGSISVRPGPGAEFRVSLPLRVPVQALP